MDIKTIKTFMKQNHITYDDLAKKSGLSISTIKKVLSGISQYPRVDTMQAIEHALGIDEPQTLSAEQQELFSLIQSLSDDEVKEMNDYLSYLLSKRK